MTTPERLRRRQMFEGAALIAVGVLMLVQAFYFQGQADRQRQCLADNFSELSVALSVRGNLAERETAQNRQLWGIYAQAAGLLKHPEDELTPAQQRRFQVKLVDQLAEYQRVIRGIEHRRRETPLPPFPAGVCQ